MIYFDKYLEKISKTKELPESVKSTSNAVFEKISNYFDYKSEITGLLLGNVQSGKTAQMFGLISKLADKDFQLFIILTTDNVQLQQQTFGRALEDLNFMEVLEEKDDLRLRKSDLSKPIVLVLKKNTKILKKWRSNLASSGFCQGRAIVILDDEADAASLNTLINKNKISQINKHLSAIKKLSSSSIYLQVTATPQSVLLQSKQSEFKPKFVHYFEPGSSYIGGDFIYSSPKSFCIEDTPENELDEIKSNSDILPVGLRNALQTFLIVCSDFKIKGKTNCNFLVHPSVRIEDHDTFANTISQNLNTFIAELSDELMRKDFIDELKVHWNKLHKSQPDISHFDDIKINLEEILDQMLIKFLIFNSQSKITDEHENGFNIIVGGNSLGRGVTFPHLQVVYYCRKSKLPQADTFWQHSRIFGYDRIKGLIRVFIPPTLHKLFTELNNSNKILIEQIRDIGLDGVQLIYPKGIKPTRKNVIDNDFVNIVVGGINFFARNPIQSDPSIIDRIVENYNEEKYHDVKGNIF